MSSIKDIVFGILILAVVVGGYQYWTVWKDALEKAKAAEVQQQKMEQDKVVLQTKLDQLTQEQKELSTQVVKKEQTIKEYEVKIAEIAAKLEDTNKKTIIEVDEQKIAKDFKKAYNLEAIPTIRVVNAPMPGDSWKIQSLVMPIDYVKLLITTQSNLVACKAQTELKDKINELNSVIKNLKDDKFALEEQKSRAYAEGYEKAFAMYIEINEQYIKLLHTPPKADLSFNWLGILGGVVTGGLACLI